MTTLLAREQAHLARLGAALALLTVVGSGMLLVLRPLETHLAGTRRAAGARDGAGFAVVIPATETQQLAQIRLEQPPRASQRPAG